MQSSNDNIVGKVVSDSSFRDCWNKSLGHVSEDSIYKKLTADLPEETALNFRFNKTSKKIEMVSLENKIHKFNFYYTFNNIDSEFLLGDVDKNQQDKGIATIVQRNMFAFFIENNLPFLSMYATKIGAYAWARMGVYPEQNQWDIVAKGINRRLDNISYYMEDKLSMADMITISTIEKLVDNKKSAKNLWKIVDNKTPFFDCKNLTWGKAMLLPYEYLPESSGIDALSYNISYSAKFDFQDKDCLARAENYFYPDTRVVPFLQKRKDGKTAFNIGKNNSSQFKVILA